MFQSFSKAQNFLAEPLVLRGSHGKYLNASQKLNK